MFFYFFFSSKIYWYRRLLKVKNKFWNRPYLKSGYCLFFTVKEKLCKHAFFDIVIFDYFPVVSKQTVHSDYFQVLCVSCYYGLNIQSEHSQCDYIQTPRCMRFQSSIFQNSANAFYMNQSSLSLSILVRFIVNVK